VICTPSDKHSLSRRDALKGAALALTAGAASWPLRAIAGAESEPEEVRLAQAGPGSADTITRPLIERGGPELTKGLRLSWVESNPGQIQLQLLSGALNIGAFGSIGAAIAVEHGTDIVLIGPSLNNHGRWIVRDNSPYRSPKDLIGKRIATQPETTETFLQARIAAALAGLDLKRDFQLFFGPPTANLAVFERGDVDAVILLEPTATRLVAAGAREIARVGDMWQEATGDSAPPFLAGRAAQRGWLDAHRALAKRIVDIESRSIARSSRIRNCSRSFMARWGFPIPNARQSSSCLSGWRGATRPNGDPMSSRSSIGRSTSRSNSASSRPVRQARFTRRSSRIA
jgi:NitT/TauT family transport system substrate-binding protein